MSGDLDLIYGNKKTPPEEKPKEQPEKILTSKHVSNKDSKQKSLQVSNDTSKQVSNTKSLEERLLSSLQASDLKPNTFRWTQKELDFIRDINYQAEVKYKTKFDKNDVARLGLEWLMEDWKVNKEESLLARLLTSKNESK